MQCLIWLFSVVPELHGFPVCCPRISLNHFEMVPVAPIITGITAVFTFHIRWTSIVRSLYLKFFFQFLFWFYYYYSKFHFHKKTRNSTNITHNFSLLSFVTFHYKFLVTISFVLFNEVVSYLVTYRRWQISEWAYSISGMTVEGEKSCPPQTPHGLSCYQLSYYLIPKYSDVYCNFPSW